MKLSWGTYIQVSELWEVGKSRSCLIEGLRPQEEVYALMTSKDDWAVSLSEECVLPATQTLLFGACVPSGAH